MRMQRVPLATIFCLTLAGSGTPTEARSDTLHFPMTCTRSVNFPAEPGKAARAPYQFVQPICPEFGASYGPQPPNAPSCSLNRAESYDLEPDTQGHVFIPFVIDKPRRLIVDTGGARSILYQSVVDELHLQIDDAEHSDRYGEYRIGGQVGFEGDRMDTIAIAPSIKVGPITFSNATFAVEPDTRKPPLADNEIAGYLGPSHLMSFDIEFDFAAHKLNFYLQNHCADRVVYWARYYAVVPSSSRPTGISS